MDGITAAKMLLKQTVILELSKAAFDGKESQLVGGLFERVLSEKLVKRDV